MAALLVSDLHIDAAEPAIGEQFIAFLDGEARGAEALYVLGDLFETWIGDDDDDPHRRAVVAALKRLSDAGVELYFQCGNRDFLYGTQFEEDTGGTLLADPLIATRYGRRVLLAHGDALCTDDVPYQRLRALVRDEGWRRSFLGLSRATRAGLADEARRGSRAHTTQQAMTLMDVNAGTVEALLRAAGVDTLVHGHTHRPGVHAFTVDGRACTRIVMGDWSRAGSVLTWNEAGFDLGTRPR
jgi:UDP-2,3-diacylglucosamine hydrolase